MLVGLLLPSNRPSFDHPSLVHEKSMSLTAVYWQKLKIPFTGHKREGLTALITLAALAYSAGVLGGMFFANVRITVDVMLGTIQIYYYTIVGSFINPLSNAFWTVFYRCLLKVSHMPSTPPSKA